MEQKSALDRAADVVGNFAKLAELIDVSAQVVSNWKARNRVPAEHCPTIERVTRECGEAVLCEELRPDMPWGVLRDQATPDKTAA